jgi:stage V sporulation protein SpoVS
MAGAVIGIVRERDQALARRQALAAKIRAHEQAVQRSIALPRTSPAPEGADSTRNGAGPCA